MNELNFHSLVENDHLESLKKKYDSLKRKIVENEKLKETEKKSALKHLTNLHKNEKKDSKNNLY